MSIPTAPPSGFRDFLPAQVAARHAAIETISRVYRSFGFQPVATSAVEDLSILLGKGGGENEKLIFKILKRGESLERAAAEKSELADLGLRFDLTLPLTRYYSRHGSLLSHPFKAFQLGPVWRAERAQKGRYREFTQCDVDIIGSDSWGAEVEVITAIGAVFSALGVDQPSVLLNDRSLIYAMLDQAGVPAGNRVPVCVILDKLDKAGRAKVLSDLSTAVGAAPAQALEAMMMAETPDLAALRAAAPEAVARLELIISALQAGSKHPDRFVLSPSLMRGFDYYTGPVFEFRHPALSGSLGGGGRYDNLTENFGTQHTPACGGSIGFERLMLILEEARKAADSGAPDAVVAVFSDELRGRSLEVAAALRAKGLSVDVYPGAGKLGRQFKYADQKKAGYALVIGPDEAARDVVQVKNLATGDEQAMTVDEVCARIAARA
ncbi:MAG TPA: histidine--tRNA ligase [Elusimicrobia bacterium]|nr:MAG: histidine--tRNA ligase [Elusimicrobia bacterium GWA2_66_18]HAZ06980.1 histidine--tRNA ligase [Elusimicrobiota bacterium]